MTNQELIDYIKQQSQQGKNKEEIRKELLAVSWEEKDIEEAFHMTGLARLPEPTASSPSTQEEVSAPSKLPIVENLLKRAFSAYKARLGTLIGIIFLSLVADLLSRGVNFFSVGILLSIILGFVAAFINFWAQISLIFAIKDREEKIGITESFRRGWHKIISFAWVSILVSFITLGGSMLFIIPGIIFSIWFAFSTYVLVSEDLRGMNALFRSKQLVDGYWWKVLWRFIVMGLIVIAIFILPFLISILLFSGSSAISASPAMLVHFGVLAITPLFAFLLIALFVAPFSAVFSFLLYEDLKKHKAQIPFKPPKKGTKIKFIIIGIIGFLLIPAILASIVLVSLGQARIRVQAVDVTINMIQLRSAIEIYSMENNYSYSGANCSLSEFIPICNNIKEYTGEMPTIKSSDQDYCSYVKLPNGEYVCISSTDIYSSDYKTTIFPGGKGYCDGIAFKCPEKR